MVQARPFHKMSCQSDQKFYLIHLNINDDGDVGGSDTLTPVYAIVRIAPVAACFSSLHHRIRATTPTTKFGMNTCRAKQLQLLPMSQYTLEESE